MDGISVERAQDLAKAGKGEISIVGNKMTGHGTSFTTDLKPRYAVVPTSGPYAADKVSCQVMEVMSDTEAVLKTAIPTKCGSSGGAVTYKIFPYVNQAAMFSSVSDRLKEGGAVGIFPEGTVVGD